MIEDNDRLPTDKPEPMKNTDWILLGIMILLFLVSFPFLWWMYGPIVVWLVRFILPISIIIILIYFTYQIIKLGNTNGEQSGSFLGNLSKIVVDTVRLLRKHLRKIALASIAGTIVFVALVVVFVKPSKEEITQQQFSKMSKSLIKHKTHYGNYPAHLGELIGNDPLKREWTEDAWGNPVSYTLTNGGVKLSSSGADGVMGTADDITLSI